jgi:hypothetical protein
MKRTFIAACVAALAVIGWERHAERNDERAYFAAESGLYRVELTGWRFPLVHDPISLLVERTRKTSLSLVLPRIEGVVEGREIRVDADKLDYVGRVVISNRKMQVNLSYQDGRPLAWNDEYTLVQRDGQRTR